MSSHLSLTRQAIDFTQLSTRMYSRTIVGNIQGSWRVKWNYATQATQSEPHKDWETWSMRTESNRQPRPWQGRALTNWATHALKSFMVFKQFYKVLPKKFSHFFNDWFHSFPVVVFNFRICFMFCLRLKILKTFNLIYYPIYLKVWIIVECFTIVFIWENKFGTIHDKPIMFLPQDKCQFPTATTIQPVIPTMLVLFVSLVVLSTKFTSHTWQTRVCFSNGFSSLYFLLRVWTIFSFLDFADGLYLHPITWPPSARPFLNSFPQNLHLQVWSLNPINACLHPSEQNLPVPYEPSCSFPHCSHIIVLPLV